MICNLHTIWYIEAQHDGAMTGVYVPSGHLLIYLPKKNRTPACLVSVTLTSI